MSIPSITVGGSLIAAGAKQDFNFPIMPLSVGQIVEAQPQGSLDTSYNGIVWAASVSAPNRMDAHQETHKFVVTLSA